MAELITQILNAKSKEREYRVGIKKLSAEIEVLDEEIEYSERTLQDKLDEEKEAYLEAQYEAIKEKFAPKIEELEAEIAKLEAMLETKDVEDTEELVKARETKEYLNTAAVAINKYYEELKKVSTTYFIDLAYVEKILTMKEFEKEFKRLPKKVEQLTNLQTAVVQPFKMVDSLSEKKGSFNVGVYVTATVGSLWVLLNTPLAVRKSVKRAKLLHTEAQRYHKLMHTLASLKLKTDEEITQIFSKLLKLKSQRIQTMLESKRGELESVEFDLQDELDAVVFDEDGFMNKSNMELLGKRSKLESLKAKLQKMEEDLEQILELLERLTGERSDYLEIERESYIMAREEREVVLPTKLLYDWTPDSNSFFEMKHGLYLFAERETVASFLQMFVFQLRNIMEWGSVQFRVLDLLGAEFVAPLMLPDSGKAKAQDITISSLRDEREQLVELMHDLLVRRKTQILQTVSNLGDYNLIQKAAGSSPMPYQIIFIVLTDALKMDEKLIQLIHNGEKLGLLVFIFMNHELLTVQLAKSIETYFNSFVELSDTGISSYEPDEYRMMLEQKELDRKSRI